MNTDGLVTEAKITKKTLARVGRGSAPPDAGKSYSVLSAGDYVVMRVRKVGQEVLVDLKSFEGREFDSLVVADENGPTDLGTVLSK